jgi:hypothetical protein
MIIDYYSDLKKVAYELYIDDLVLPDSLIVKGDFEAGDLVVMASSGKVPKPVVNRLTLRYEKGAIRSITRDLTITKRKDEITNLYVTENYTQEWKFKQKE